MTTLENEAPALADGVADLAVSTVGNDLSRRFVLSRLDGALDRIAARLAKVLTADELAPLRFAADALKRLPAGDRAAVESHPYYMYWLVKQYERCVAGDRAALAEAMPDVGRFVLLPAARHGLTPDGGVVLRARGGQLRFPGHLRHVLLPVGTPDGPVHATVDGDRLNVRGPGCDVHVPVAELLGEVPPGGGSPVAERPLIPGTEIEVDGTDPFVGDLYASMNARPPMAGYPPRDLAAMPVVAPETLGHLAAACELISRAWPAAGAELLGYTRLLVPFVSRSYSTFAEAAFPGAVFMGESRHPFSDLMYTAEHLLHEHSHVRLCMIMEQDPVFHGSGDTLVESPWRRDPRPLIGIVQGVFVFARVARFLRYAHRLTGEQRYARRRIEVVADVEAALRVLEVNNVGFTPLGRTLLDQFAAEARTPVEAGPGEQR
jgi:HEXXH motif-containing protein